MIDLFSKKKGIAFLMLFLLITLTFSCTRDSNLKEWTPVGDVISYTDTIYTAKDRFGNIEKDELLSVQKHFLNEQNKDTLLIKYDNTGKEEERIRYTYDDNENVVKEVSYSKEETVDDFGEKSVSETTRTKCYTYKLDEGDISERKTDFYYKRYYDGIDSCVIDGEIPHVQTTDYDTAKIATLYKYEIPQEVPPAPNDSTDVCYITDGKISIYTRRPRKYRNFYWLYDEPDKDFTYNTYNEYGLLKEEKYRELENKGFYYRSYYEYDANRNPVKIKIYYNTDTDRDKKPYQLWIRHYEYK